MSLMALSRAFKKHGGLLAGVGALMMLVLALSGLGANLGHGGAPDSQSAGTSSDEPVATIDDKKITKGQIDPIIESYMRGQTPPAAMMDTMRVELLDQFKRQEALHLAARAAGVKYSDDDIARERDNIWVQQRVGYVATLGLPKTATDADVDQALAKLGNGLTVATLKQKVAADDTVRDKLDQDGLLALMKKKVVANADDVKKSYDEIQVRHILVATGAKGLPDAKAKEKAQALLTQILADPAKMPELAKQSDDPGSKSKGGFYDWAPAGQYVPEFTAGAFAAGLGKVNPQLIKTSFGYHIIKLEGERPGKDFPKDWDKNKQKYIDDYVAKIADANVKSAVEAQMPNVKVTILDSGMLAAQLEADAQKETSQNAKNAKLNEALADLNKIKPETDPTGSAPMRRAQILTSLKRTKDAEAEYLKALDARNDIETRLALAGLYQGDNDKPNALKQVQEAEKLAVPDVTTQQRIAKMLDDLGSKDEAKQAHAKATEMQVRQIENEEAEKAAAAAAMPSVTKLPSPAPAKGKSPAGAVVSPPVPSAAATPAPSASAGKAGSVASPAVPAASASSPASAAPVPR